MTPVEWVISMHFLAFEVKVSPVSCLLHMTSSNNMGGDCCQKWVPQRSVTWISTGGYLIRVEDT